MLESSQPWSSALQAFADVFNVSSPEAAMRIACRRLLRESGLETPPIPLKPLCKRLGITVLRRPTLGTATLRATRQQLEIWIDPDKQQWRRQRFSIAHELAHVILIQSMQRSRYTLNPVPETKEYQEVERLCNIGAAELLMPSQEVVESLNMWSLDPTGIQSLYDLFLVSYRALFFRLADVIPSSAVIFWKYRARTGADRLAMRVDACYKTDRYPWLPKDCTTRYVSPDIVTQAFEDQHLVYAGDLELQPHRKQQWCIGLATVPPSPRKVDDQLPLFHDVVVRDETELDVDVVLLAGIKNMSEGSRAWSNIARHVQK